jgi:hypothetical protein
MHRFKPDGGPDEGPDWRPAPESMRQDRGRTLRYCGDSAAVRLRALARLGHARGRVAGSGSPLLQKVCGPCADSRALGHLANSCLPRTWRAQRLVDPPSLGRPVVSFPHVVLIANPCRNRLGSESLWSSHTDTFGQLLRGYPVDTFSSFLWSAYANVFGQLLRLCLVGNWGALLRSAYADTFGQLLRGYPVWSTPWAT